MRISFGPIVALALALAAPAVAKPVAPTSMPISRLLRNVGAFVDEHPKDADAVYLLGRIHYFAFASPQKPPKNEGWGKPDAIQVVRGDQPLPRPYDHAENPGKNTAARPSWYERTPAQQVAHIRSAVTLLAKALTLRGAKPSTKDNAEYASRPGLFELCLACALDDGAAWASKVGAIPGVVASGNAKAWREAAIANYKLAYERALDSDRKNPVVFGPSVTEEAGRMYKQMVAKRGPTLLERAFLVKLDIDLARLPREYAVTPIVFSLDSAAGLDSLLSPQTTVSFDLDGSGRPQKLSWVKPETGILVWDEDGKGKITSGRQLFGSVTWWMFWEDGYRALDALDDDRDGWLTGSELKGLGVWFDRNQNGVSEPGEVVSLSQTPIVGIATHSTGKDGLSPMNSAGLRLRDGRMLPTFDWVVTVETKAGR